MRTVRGIRSGRAVAPPGGVQSQPGFRPGGTCHPPGDTTGPVIPAPWSRSSADASAAVGSAAAAASSTVAREGRRGGFSFAGVSRLPGVPPPVRRVDNADAGHADIVRELIDGAAGWRADNDNLPGFDQASWSAYRDRLETVAREAAAKS